MVDAERVALDALLSSPRLRHGAGSEPGAADYILSLSAQARNGDLAMSDSFQVMISSADTHDRAQADSAKQGRVDLNEEVADLLATPVLKDFASELLGPTPDRKLLKALGGPFRSVTKFETSKAQSSTVLQLVPEKNYLPKVGGEVGSCEVMREIRLTCRYAKWRDRRIRRLARVQVTCFYAFVVPSGWLGQ